ncbi:hypothetical protein [Aeromonas veronii]|uniref:hypothetical protein n=1 Tax=Aeromonas veronii TaxID=654 RepID=UPI003BA2BC03
MPVKGSMITTDEFISKCKLIHGDKYIYDKTVYTGENNKIVIICPEHGEFEMRASAHAGKQKQGCKACAGRPEVTTEIFIAKSKDKFKSRFEYDKVKYINAITHVTITCPEHGDFSIIPNSHLHGNGGCKACSGRPDITNEQYIQRLKDKFGDDYDYSSVEYTGAFNEVSVICRQHGEFKKQAFRLPLSEGCPKCLQFTQDDFLAKAINTHGNLYDYTAVKYINTKEYITIICREHGPFEQTPNRHLDGRGCPACGVERNLLANRSPDDFCIVYYLKLLYKGHFFWKIGITTKSIDIRYKLLVKDDVIIADSQQISTTIQMALKIEHEFIRVFGAHLEYRGHILKNAKGGTECFSIDVLASKGMTLSEFIKNTENALLD